MATEELIKTGIDAHWRPAYFNSFEGIADLYKAIKPINERGYGKSRDIRPINNRSNKAEKIRKIDEDTYVLLDGGYGDTLTWYEAHPRAEDSVDKYTPQDIEEMIAFAPIVWRYDRERDIESVTIRNHTSPDSTLWRLRYLRLYVPDPMIVPPTIKGKEYIRICDGERPSDDRRVYLPRSNAYPKSWQERTSQPLNRFPTEDGVALTFARNGLDVTDKWRWLSGGAAEYVTRRRVDKERKKQYLSYIDAYWDYLVSYAPFVSDDFETGHTYISKLAEYLVDEEYLKRPNFARYDIEALASMNRNRAIEVVTDNQNPYRLHLLYWFMEKKTQLRSVKNLTYDATEEEARKVRSQFTSFMNEWLGLMYSVEELVAEGK